MPVTIGTLTSNVDVVEASGTLTQEVMEHIVKMVMTRLKEERYLEEQARQEREIRDRMSESEPF
jgi:phosphoglycerate dehydrogenase-like enzyme